MAQRAPSADVLQATPSAALPGEQVLTPVNIQPEDLLWLPEESVAQAGERLAAADLLPLSDAAPAYPVQILPGTTAETAPAALQAEQILAAENATPAWVWPTVGGAAALLAGGIALRGSSSDNGSSGRKDNNNGGSDTPTPPVIDPDIINNAPTNITLSANTLPENTVGARIGRLSTTDADTNDTHSYTVSDARFEVVNGYLKLKAGQKIDYADEQSVKLTVTTTDSAGAKYSKAFIVQVQDDTNYPTPVNPVPGNNAPTNITLSANTLPENTVGARIGRLSTTDLDANDTHSYTVSDSRFEVVNGYLKLKAGQKIDYAKEQSVKLTVTTTDSAGAKYSKAFTVQVQDDPNYPTPNQSAQVRISGKAEVGQVLTATVSDGNGVPSKINYQWYADGKAISGATTAKYTLAPTDAGKNITVKASFTDNAGYAENPASKATEQIAKAPLGVYVPAAATNVTVNAKSYGAKGDGKTDDTKALQAAVDAVAAKGGGIVDIPAGTYMVDAVKSIRVKSNVIMRMSDDTVLKVIPNDSGSYALLTLRDVDNAHIIGGTLLGDRNEHSGSSGEYGMGVLVRSASNVVIENVTAKDFWGDGFYTGKSTAQAAHTENVVFYNVTADNNRRQGITISDGKNIKVLDSTFENTHGIKPQAGIDIEPNSSRQEKVTGVEIRGNSFVNNTGHGVQVGGNQQSYDSIFDVTIADNRFEHNGHSIYITGLKGGLVSGNTIYHDNFAYPGANADTDKPRMGIFFAADSRPTEGVTVEDNTIYGSGIRTWPTLLQNNTIGDNTYKAGIVIRGEAQVGKTLTSYVYDHDGLPAAGAIRYQWQADGADIAGATGSSFTVTAAERGKAISVKVAFKDQSGQNETAVSAATQPVGAQGKLGMYVPEAATDFVANAKSYGAKGDGKTDDTAAIQKAIDAVAAKGGGIVDIPAGIYMVDGVSKGGINVRSNVTIRMTDDTVMKAIPNDKTSYTVFRIHNADNAHIIGGTIIGERDEHQGTTGQGGFGVRVQSSHNVVIENVTAKDFWGDGFIVMRYNYNERSPENVVFYNVTADNNRRQGMSITDGNNIKVIKSVFKNTNGHSPESGIDIEPNPSHHSPVIKPDGTKVAGKVTNVEIIDSVFENNAAYGVVASANGDSVVANVRLINNQLFDNQSAIRFNGVKGGEVAGNTMRDSGKHIPYFDIELGRSSDIHIHDNTLYGGRIRTDEQNALVDNHNITVQNNATKAAVYIRGALVVGETLKAVVEDGDGVRSNTVKYQWYANGKAISGATGSSYVVKQADSGKAMTVAVSFTDRADTAETATSKATLPIGSITQNQAPTDLSISNNTLMEGKNGAQVGRLKVTDADWNDDHTYSVSDSRFEIDAYGLLKLKAGQKVDFASEKSIRLTVTAKDQAGATYKEAFTIAVQDDPNYPAAPRSAGKLRAGGEELGKLSGDTEVSLDFSQVSDTAVIDLRQNSPQTLNLKHEDLLTTDKPLTVWVHADSEGDSVLLNQHWQNSGQTDSHTAYTYQGSTLWLDNDLSIQLL
ncbi:polygalacturonase [Neisseria sp. HSC-16F19]|nr:right-handed parallel beta-helix repeat-containing protein [Neisseria sp. HSC-16F19]MCP2041639.1 polygalacturonase [Neisseria sp. HSC-16F19]